MVRYGESMLSIELTNRKIAANTKIMTPTPVR